MNDNIPVQDSAPTEVGPDLDAIDTQTFDSKVDDMFAELYPEAAAQVPDQTDDSSDESDQVAEADEQESPADESPTVEETAEEVTEEETAQDESNVEWNDVEYKELKEGNFRIPIKNSDTGAIEYKTIDQINSEVNRGRGQEEARNEVEQLRQEAESMKAAAEASEYAQQQRVIVEQGNQQMSQIESQMVQLKEARDKALETNDANRLNVISAHLQKLQEAREGIQGKVDAALNDVAEAQGKAAEEAANKMKDFGFGDLLTDKQRQSAFVEYAKETLPPHLASVFNTNAEAMVILEKARLYDKGQSAVKGAKLKGTKKSLRGGATKSPKAAPKTSGLQAKIDAMFDT